MRSIFNFLHFWQGWRETGAHHNWFQQEVGDTPGQVNNLLQDWHVRTTIHTHVHNKGAIQTRLLTTQKKHTQTQGEYTNTIQNGLEMAKRHTLK